MSIYVSNLDRSLQFYQDLEMDFVKKIVDEENRSWAFLRVAKGQYLTLVSSVVRNSGLSHKLDDTYGHFALQVESLEFTAKRWAKNGIFMCPHPHKQDEYLSLDPFEAPKGLDGCIIGWVIDPDGNKIEVMEQPGNSIQQQWEKQHPMDIL
jgi:catechol 2,3-dioxygenase-like lactoylglutathione lyase family enzyme